MDKQQARNLLKEQHLRATGPRLAVILVLAAAKTPLSYGEVRERLGETDWDPATIYRNLVKLKEAGLAPVVSRAEGIDRYALAISGDGERDHHHPHFLCDDCGRIACLPGDWTMSIAEGDPWSRSIRKASVQLSGNCPECLAAKQVS